MTHMEKETLEIDLRILLVDLLREARRLLLLGLVLALLGAAALTGYTYLTYTPRYRASASFNVKVANPLQATVSAYNTETAEQMAKTFPYILTSGVLQQRVQQMLDISAVPAITADVMENSNIFTLRVTDTDPQRAYDVLQAVMTCYPEISDYVVGPTVMYLINESGVPEKPYNPPSPMRSLALGAGAGAVIWMVIVIALALLKTTVHNEEELSKLLNIECLSHLPVVKKKDRRPCPLITGKRDPYGFAESVRLLRLRLDKQMKQEGRKVLMVSSAIPSEGKTTVAVNLAVSLARKGNQVLLIDWDLRNPSAAKALQQADGKGMAEFLSGQVAAKDVVRTGVRENLDLLAGTNPATSVYQDHRAMDRAAVLLELARKHYDFVIVDTPPCSLLADASELTELMDGALMVIRQDFATQEQILDGIQCLTDGRLAVLGCVFNGVAAGSGYGYGYGYGSGYRYGYGYGYGYGQRK